MCIRDRHHRMLELATFVTWPRAGHPVDPTALAQLDLDEAERASLLDHTLDLPADDVAASDLRARLRSGDARPEPLHPDVADYIRAHGLYR